MQFAKENVPYNLDDPEMNRTVPAILFSWKGDKEYRCLVG